MNEDILAKFLMLGKACSTCRYHVSKSSFHDWCYLKTVEPPEKVCAFFADMPTVEITLPFSGQKVTANDTRVFPFAEWDANQTK
jgi:hypothetical protein